MVECIHLAPHTGHEFSATKRPVLLHQQLNVSEGFTECCAWRLQIQKGLWYDANGKRAIITQYHEVIGSLLGMWAQIIVQLVIIISLVGTSFAQIVACASDVYYYDSSKTKREW